MRPDLLRWLGCGLVAVLGLLAVTIAPSDADVAPRTVHAQAAAERTVAAAPTPNPEARAEP